MTEEYERVFRVTHRLTLLFPQSPPCPQHSIQPVCLVSRTKFALDLNSLQLGLKINAVSLFRLIGGHAINTHSHNSITLSLQALTDVQRNQLASTLNNYLYQRGICFVHFIWKLLFGYVNRSFKFLLPSLCCPLVPKGDTVGSIWCIFCVCRLRVGLKV